MPESKVTYNDRTKEYLDDNFPDAMSDSEAIRSAIGQNRTFKEILIEARKRAILESGADLSIEETHDTNSENPE